MWIHWALGSVWDWASVGGMAEVETINIVSPPSPPLTTGNCSHLSTAAASASMFGCMSCLTCLTCLTCISRVTAHCILTAVFTPGSSGTLGLVPGARRGLMGYTASRYSASVISLHYLLSMAVSVLQEHSSWSLQSCCTLLTHLQHWRGSSLAAALTAEDDLKSNIQQTNKKVLYIN